MKGLYKTSSNDYEKLYLYRIIYDEISEVIDTSAIQKLIN